MAWAVPGPRSDQTKRSQRWNRRAGMWFRFFLGLGYLAMVAAFICVVVGKHFLIVFLSVVCGAMFCCGLALVWLTLWALRDDSRLGQFGIGSLFFLTGFVAIYFAAVRSLVMMARQYSPSQAADPGLFVGVAIACLLLALLAIPFVLSMAESLLWLAVWTVHRPTVRRWLRDRRRRSGR